MCYAGFSSSMALRDSLGIHLFFIRVLCVRLQIFVEFFIFSAELVNDLEYRLIANADAGLSEFFFAISKCLDSTN